MRVRKERSDSLLANPEILATIARERAQGIPYQDICRSLRISPATYYRALDRIELARRQALAALQRTEDDE